MNLVEVGEAGEDLVHAGANKATDEGAGEIVAEEFERGRRHDAVAQPRGADDEQPQGFLGRSTRHGRTVANGVTGLVELEFGSGCGCAPEGAVAVLVFVPLIGDTSELGEEAQPDDAVGLEREDDSFGRRFDGSEFDPFALGKGVGGRFHRAPGRAVVEGGAVQGAETDGCGHRERYGALVPEVPKDESRVNGRMADSKGRTMAPVQTTTEIPRARIRRRAVWLFGLVGLGAIVAVGMRAQQERMVQAAMREFATQAGVTQANVVRHLRTCELVTSRIETIVRAQNNNDNWFGSVVATVEAPARLSYGVDLSKLESSRVVFSPIGAVGGVYSLKVPPPKRIATEVFTGQEKTDVALAGLRFRSIAGEEQLGIARARLHEQALRMRITGAESERIRESARAEIAGLVKRIVGEGASVRVWFEDEEGWRTTMATEE